MFNTIHSPLSIFHLKLGCGIVNYKFDDIKGSSKEILKTKELAINIANNNSSVLIYGETGTGKELFVSAIHNESSRKNGPFIAYNCAAIPLELAESILFGSISGAYTDAKNQKGVFELANNGTLYLDELNSMPIQVQGKLLRAIQEGYINRVGDVNSIRVNVRVIASVNEDFKRILKNKNIRNDLFFRLNVNTLEIPKLADRIEDIKVLSYYFIEYYNKKFNSKVSGISKEALKKLIGYDWPGNIRELKNVIERSFLYQKEGILEDKYIELDFSRQDGQSIGLKEKVFIYERNLIREALIISNNNISKAAEYLKIPRQTLQNKIRIFGLKDV